MENISTHMLFNEKSFALYGIFKLILAILGTKRMHIWYTVPMEDHPWKKETSVNQGNFPIHTIIRRTPSHAKK